MNKNETFVILLQGIGKAVGREFYMTSEQIERLKGNNRSWWDDTRLIEAPVYGCLFQSLTEKHNYK